MSGQAVDLRSSATTSAPHCPSSPEPHHDIDEHTSHPPPATPSQVTMLLLDYQNVLIQSVLMERFSG